MDPANYLANLTGFPNPMRFRLRTRKDVTNADRQKQADLAYKYLCLLHSNSCEALRLAYEKIRTARDDWFEKLDDRFEEIFLEIRDCCYPCVSVPEESISNVMSPAFSPPEVRATDAGPEQDQGPAEPYAIRMPTIDHVLTIANPKVMRPYLRREIYRLIREGYAVDVGLSIVPIPILFALENCGGAEQPLGMRTEVVQSFFPMPNIAEIEDSFVDGTYKRRQSSTFINHEYQLFYSRFWQRYKIYLTENAGRSISWRTGSSSAGPVFEAFRSQAGGLFEPTVIRDSNPYPPRVPLRYPKRLGYFDALRTDYSCARLRHYTHTAPEDFQPYVLFTNYAKYVRRFVMRAIAEILEAPPRRPCTLIVPLKGNRAVIGRDVVERKFSKKQRASIRRLAQPGAALEKDAAQRESIESIIDREFVSSDCQLPAYHFIPSQIDGAKPRPKITDEKYRKSIFDKGPLPGITLVNIGVGPSNARTITDHIAVLRPFCWIMVGHCGGLRNRQKLGHYVMANGYVRRDGVLDDEVPLDAPVHGTRVINFALLDAVRHRTEGKLRVEEKLRGKRLRAQRVQSASVEEPGTESWLPPRSKDTEPGLGQWQIDVLKEIREIVRVGPVISVSNRNWETSPTEDVFELFERYRVVAVDMESAALAANGYRYRVPHGTFLCVSDKPLHGAIKMRHFSDDFYRSQTDRHLDLAMDALKWLSIDLDGAIDLLNARELRGIDDPPWR